MNLAIYFVSVGVVAKPYTELAHQSLRNAGFEGDVFIMTDDLSLLDISDKRTKILQIQDTDINLSPNTIKPLAYFDVRRLISSNRRNHRNPAKFVICHTKSLIDKYIDITAYDYVMYLDSDVLTQGPIRSVLTYLQNKPDFIHVAKNGDDNTLGGRGNFSFRKFARVKTTVAANLNLRELLRHWFTPAICADIVAFPGNKTGSDFLKKWRNECQKGIDSDQAALQAVLLRYFKNIYKIAPGSVFGSGTRASRYDDKELPAKVSSLFVHFQGALKDGRAFKKYYQTFLTKKV